ncbi:peroxisomal biogenesis factor 3 [Anopheles ziemanni]|uniref:peroxisomal biogenesis factor 3 n=1 Tax=Anopheles coustani TaxID=139045 RepID=UPI00265942BC|nr:peroxisomal biogenesis factor 3 [Anopheles coustani]XP_058172025.1 peroxisomal biogenesis factor 3 [Anopheles ziemanni]
MLSRIKSFLCRHRRKFVTTGVVIGGCMLLLKWTQYKLREMQERQAKEISEKLKRMQHFECTERTCNQTIAGIAPALSEKIFQLLDTDSLLVKLRSNPGDKLMLWEDIKIVAFTRLVTLVYAASMLGVTMKVQLNLLGGYLYKNTVEVDDQQKQQISENIQKAYLSMIQHFMGDGIEKLIDIVRQNVTTVMQRYSLKQQLTLADAEALLWSFQMALNNEEESPTKCIARYTLPPASAADDSVFKRLFEETLDVLESVESSDVLLANVSNGFSLIVDKLADYYVKAEKISDTPAENSKSNLNVESLSNINNIKISLAKLIPIVSGLACKMMQSNGGLASNGLNMPDLGDADMMSWLIIRFLQSEKLRTLGANVYETFCQ